jgi:hypothetical protein
VNRVARLGGVVVGVVAVVLAAVVVPALLARDASGPPLGAVLDGPDRRELDAVPVRRGAAPLPADPAVDLRDPRAVARAYLVASRATTADDRGRTHLRAAAYAEPGSPPAAVGVVVLDPPPPGQLRTATVSAIDLIATDEADERRGYRATVAVSTGPTPPIASGTTVLAAYLVLARQPNGRWLVAADSPALPDGND